MKKHGTLKSQDIPKCTQKIFYVMSVKRPKVAKTELFKNNTGNDDVF